MENQGGSILGLLILGAFLFLFFKFHTVPQYRIWKKGIHTDGIITGFDFSNNMQGKLRVDYRLQGQDLAGKIDNAFFADYQEGESIAIIINPTNQKIDWAAPIRFWFIDIAVLGALGGTLLLTCVHLLPNYQLFSSQAWGILLMSIGIIFVTILFLNGRSVRAYQQVSEPVTARVSDVATETCTRKSGDDEVTYTCYRPTYTYGYGRVSYTKLAESTFEEQPTIGQLQELYVWQENHTVAKKINKISHVAHNVGVLFLGLLFVWGAWLFVSFRG